MYNCSSSFASKLISFTNYHSFDFVSSFSHHFSLLVPDIRETEEEKCNF